MKLRFLEHGLSLLVALAVVATPGFAQQKGDPSGDGKIGELNDAFLARQMAVGKRPFDARADVFPVNCDTATLGDGVIDVRDVLVFLQGLVGLLAPDIATSKRDVGQPISVAVTPATATLSSGGTLTLGSTVTGAQAGEVTGVTFSINPEATAAGFTIAAAGATGATLTAPATIPNNISVVTVSTAITGPASTGRPRTCLGTRVVTLSHAQGGGG